jgi:hypothetical protein
MVVAAVVMGGLFLIAASGAFAIGLFVDAALSLTWLSALALLAVAALVALVTGFTCLVAAVRSALRRQGLQAAFGATLGLTILATTAGLVFLQLDGLAKVWDTAKILS